MRYEDLFESTDSDMFTSIEEDGLGIVESDQVLYRGSIAAKGDETRLVTTRKDRKPLDVNELLHFITDAWFFDKFGIKAQSECVFSAPDVRFAMRYGTACAILPRNNAKYIFSEKVHDLFHTFKNTLIGSIADTSEIVNQYGLDIDSECSVNDFAELATNKFKNDVPMELHQFINKVATKVLNDCDYQMVDDISILQNRVEVMIYCESYYMVGRDSPASYKLEAKYQYLI